MDGLRRCMPCVLGHHQSAEQDAVTEGLLAVPHYTRPVVVEDQQVPDVLLSGNHEEIRRWRLKQQLGRTWQRRPDLLEDLELNAEQQALLTDYIHETEKSDG